MLNHLKRCLVMVLVLVLFALPTMANVAVTPTPYPNMGKGVMVDTIVNAWSDNRGNWKDMDRLSGTTLSEGALLRLSLTHIIDRFPDMPLSHYLEYEPIISIKQVGEELVWQYNSFTNRGDIVLQLDAGSGALLKVQEEGGGNG